jgi:hypothetical protein
MKRFAVVLAVTAICLFSSNQVSLAQHKHSEMNHASKKDSTHAHHESKETSGATTKTEIKSMPITDTKAAASMSRIVDSYLKLKNSLAGDKSKNAADAGKEMVDAMGKMNASLLTDEQAKLYKDVEDDAKEHAEHIGANAGNIKHQREHFDMLSKDIYDLVKAFGGGRVLYKDFCPMYNDKKGAIWLSESKTIKNPYYGKSMSTCGSVQEEMK